MDDIFAPRVVGLVLYSQQIEAARTFYEQILDMQFQRHTDHGPAHYATTSSSGFLLEIYATNKRERALDKPLIEVRSLEQILSRLAASQIIKPASQTDHGLLAIIQDPDGRSVLLLQKK